MPHRLFRSAFLTAFAVALVGVPSAPAAPAATPGALHVGFPQANAFPGALWLAEPIVADVGDIDGDGLEDTAVAVPTDDGTETVWVTFAGAAGSSVEAGQPGWRGFAIAGAQNVEGLEGVGDTNGDGIRDIAITTEATTTPVVYGRRDGGTTDLRGLGTGGFTIAHTSSIGGAGGGSGTVDYGYATGSRGAVAVGDQDGDGRADVAVLALPEGGGAERIAVVRSPGAPGTTVDATAPADRVFSYGWSGSHGWTDFGSLGDLDGDGRQDLSVGWSTDAAVHVAGVISPAAGTDVTLEDVAADHRGFLYASTAAYDFRGFTTVGDQNGDGHRDTAVMAGRVGRELNLLPSLAAGSEQTFTPGIDGMHADAIVPVGDQDGDGREDVTDMGSVHFARGGEAFPSGFRSVYLVGSVADRNGDGRRELLGLHADPFNDPTWTGSGASVAKYQLDTYFGLGADCCPAPAPPTTPAVPVQPPVRPLVVRKPKGKRVTGTKKNDRLTGTPYDDVIKGLAGNDVIKGLAGDDVIDGGPGRDRIDAGAGNDRISARDGAVDTINCGPGRDTVIADQADRVKGCERVSRPKAKHTRKRAKTKPR